MFLGTLVGFLMGKDAAMFAPLGTIFIHLIKMLVVPLIVISIISGAANLSDSPSAGRVWNRHNFIFSLEPQQLQLLLHLLQVKYLNQVLDLIYLVFLICSQINMQIKVCCQVRWRL